jgi:autotransporter-associated beta strand protein
MPARRALLASASLLALALAEPAKAQDATWLANPGSGDFNTGGNWTPAAVPTGTAFFNTSATTALSISALTTVGGFTFNAGASNYNLTNNWSLTFTGAGIDVQGGSLTITNPNSVDFRNGATAGSISIFNTSGGSTNFYNTSSAGSATIDTNNGGVTFFDSSTAGHSTITNSGNVSNISFNNTSSAGSASISTAGSISFYDASTAANAAITVTGSGGVYFGGTSTAGSATIIFNGTGNIDFLVSSSAGNATITNYRSAIFEGAATAANATITNTSSGDIGFGNTATAGAATIINSGAIRFFTNSSGGSARLINNPGGVFDFSLLASAGTTVGSIEGAGTFNLGSKTLTVGGNGLSTTFGGIIADGGFSGLTGGALVKVGSGTLTLSGTNTYTGATTVDAGALVVNGSIAASSGVAVNNGGTLAGTGTVGATTVASGGTLAAGNNTAGSSLNVAGSLALQSGAFYMVQINPATSSFANVTGAATLGGSTVKAIYGNGSYVAKQYTILTAGSVSGTFASVAETNLPPNFHSTLSYDTTHAYLNLVLSFVPPPGTGLSGNQNAVGNAITNSFNANGGISLVYSGLTAGGLTQAAGETATGSQQTTFQAMTQFMGLLTDPFSAGRDTGTSAPPAYADSGPASSARDAYAMLAKAPLANTYDPRWSEWAAGFGGSQTTDGNTAQGSNSATSRLFGTAAGAEYLFSAQTLAGFSLAGGGTNFSVTNGGTGRSDLFQAGAYFRHSNGPSYISAALAYGWQDVTTDRTVTLAGVDHLRAEFNANAWSGRLEGGYRLVAPWVGGIGLTPYAAGQFTTFNLPAYTESVVSGGGAFALAYGAESVTDPRSEFGLRTDKSFAMQSGVLTLRGRAAWAHDFDPDRAVAATFQALPGASFVVNGAQAAADSALTTVSAEMKWLSGWSASATFEGEFSNVTRSYAGKSALRYQW